MKPLSRKQVNFKSQTRIQEFLEFLTEDRFGNEFVKSNLILIQQFGFKPESRRKLKKVQLTNNIYLYLTPPRPIFADFVAFGL